MKQCKKDSDLEGVQKEPLKQRSFTLEFKAEVVRHKKAENLSWADCVDCTGMADLRTSRGVVQSTLPAGHA